MTEKDRNTEFKEKYPHLWKNFNRGWEAASYSNWSFLAENNYVRRLLKAAFDMKKSISQAKKERFSYQTVAEKIGCNRAEIYDYFKDRKRLSDFKIIKLADHLGFEISVNLDVKR